MRGVWFAQPALHDPVHDPDGNAQEAVNSLYNDEDEKEFGN